ncbi:MAG: M16 family metallopeptidase [Desulfomonilaceae bacterium]
MNELASKLCLEDSTFQKTVLDNGVRILTEKLPYLKTVSICIWVLTGSRIEEQNVNGISHFVEHMLFKGTTRRDAFQISKEIDCVGGSLNAFTSKEATSYYCRILSDHLSLGLDVLTDMYLNSCFKEDEIDREKQVVCQEIRQQEDSPEDFVNELFNMRFWQGDSFGHPILGSINNVLLFDRESLIKFKTENYGPLQTIVCAAGNLEHGNIVSFIENEMGSLKNRAVQKQQTKPKISPGCLIHEKDLEQVHVCIGVEGPNIRDNDRNVACLFSALFGGGMSSRLFQEIREKRGLVYNVYSYYAGFSDTGMIGIYASTEPDKFQELLDVLGQEIIKVTKTITDDELRNAKNQIRGNIIMLNESVEYRVGRIAKSEIYHGRYVSAEDTIGEIDKVTLKEVQDFASRFLNSERYTVTALGRISQSMDILSYFNRN